MIVNYLCMQKKDRSGLQKFGKKLEKIENYLKFFTKYVENLLKNRTKSGNEPL